MATGASTADAAVILVDARHGVLTQTRRHSYIVGLLGVRHVILAVNKMDLVGWSEDAFRAIASDYSRFAQSIGLTGVHALPVSALRGDNVIARSASAPWYKGPALLPLLESVNVRDVSSEAPFRMPVQWVNRPHQDLSLIHI